MILLVVVLVMGPRRELPVNTTLDSATVDTVNQGSSGVGRIGESASDPSDSRVPLRKSGG